MATIDEPVTCSLYLESDLNRVFTGSLGPVAAAELRLVVDALLPDRVGPIDVGDAGRATVLRFPVTGPVADVAAVVAQLSASAALFVDAGDGDLVRPVPLCQRLVHGTELVTTQRYRGKTSERLTRAMLNVALALAGRALGPGTATATGGPPAADQPTDAEPRPATVLDPLCGRGTTLHWVLAYGGHGLGIEIEPAALDEHAHFLTTWAKRSRLPHRAVAHRAGNAEHRHTTLRVATDRATLRGGGGQRIETFAADGTDAGVPIGRGRVDAVVTDLPYGIRHRTGGRADDDTATLLERGLPTWRRWLRPGGALCLSWNTRRLDRPVVAGLVAAAGYHLVEPPGATMAHTVDATIDRDVMAAVTPGRAARR